ncbi:MAG: hypothetical protein JWP34_5310 [Massilia sp.]|nr:hypothetical protein [Massilia sp.]
MSARKSPELVADPSPLDFYAAAHTPFSWLHFGAEDDRSAQFAALAVDVCSGVDLCLEILHADHMVRLNNQDADPGEEERPAFSPSDGERLLRLAMVSTRLLAEAAMAATERANALARRAKGAAS